MLLYVVNTGKENALKYYTNSDNFQLYFQIVAFFNLGKCKKCITFTKWTVRSTANGMACLQRVNPCKRRRQHPTAGQIRYPTQKIPCSTTVCCSVTLRLMRISLKQKRRRSKRRPRNSSRSALRECQTQRGRL